MAFFNIEDFMKAAGAVANGELAGKMQAQNEQRQRATEDMQRALTLNQASQQQDESQFANEDAYDQHILQNVLPRLAPHAQTELLNQLNQKKATREQARAAAAQRRAGFLPPWMQGFFHSPQPPQGFGSVGSVGSPIGPTTPGQSGAQLPVTPTQPPPTQGPMGTVQENATGTVNPAANGLPQLPTAPAAPPPGTPPPTVPAAPVAAPPDLSSLPNVGNPLGAPQAPSAIADTLTPPAPVPPPDAGGAPPDSVAAPPALDTTAASTPNATSTPAAAPPAAGVDTTPSPPAFQPQMMQIHWFQGNFEVAGLTSAQVKDYEDRRKQAKTLIEGFTGDPTIAASLQRAWSQLPASITDEGQMRQANDALQQIEAYRTGNSEAAARIKDGEFRDLGTGIRNATANLVNVKTSPKMGASLVMRILGLEAQAGKKFPDKFDPTTEGTFAGWEDQIKDLREATKAGDTERANQIAGTIAEGMRNNDTPEKASEANRVVLSIMNTLSSADRSDPKKLAAALRVFGYEEIAKRVEQGQIQFGGYRAERTFQDLIKAAPRWAGMSDPDRQAFIEQIKTAGRAAGMSEAQVQQWANANLDLKEKPLSLYQQALLKNSDRNYDLNYKKFQESQYRTDLMAQRIDDLEKKQTGGGGASMAAQMRGPQHLVDQTWQAYRKYIDTYALTDAQLDSPTSPIQRDAAKARDNWRKAYQSFRTVYQRATGVDPDTGARLPEAQSTALKRPGATAQSGGTDLASLPTRLSPQQKADLNRRLAGMSFEQRVAFMQKRHQQLQGGR